MVDRNASTHLLERLRRRQPVTARELERAVGVALWERYRWSRASNKDRRAEAKIASHKLRPYVKMLQIADLRDAQAARIWARTRKVMRRGKRPSELYERALEALAELVDRDHSILNYLDRPFPLPDYSGVDADKESVPRPWFHTQNSLVKDPHMALKTIRQLQIEVLEEALAEP